MNKRVGVRQKDNEAGWGSVRKSILLSFRPFFVLTCFDFFKFYHGLKVQNDSLIEQRPF